VKWAGWTQDLAQLEELKAQVRQLEDKKGKVICQGRKGIIRADYDYVGKQVSIALEGTNKSVIMVMEVSSQMTKHH
jgi:hypothetical protein